MPRIIHRLDDDDYHSMVIVSSSIDGDDDLPAGHKAG